MIYLIRQDKDLVKHIKYIYVFGRVIEITWLREYKEGRNGKIFPTRRMKLEYIRLLSRTEAKELNG